MAASGHSDALEAALDELYGVDQSEFVAARKRLAADLRTAGDKDGAKILQAARRPTTAAWALNQLSRHEPALVESFLEAGRELQAAQIGGALVDAKRCATRPARIVRRSRRPPTPRWRRWSRGPPTRTGPRSSPPCTRRAWTTPSASSCSGAA